MQTLALICWGACFRKNVQKEFDAWWKQMLCLWFEKDKSWPAKIRSLSNCVKTRCLVFFSIRWIYSLICYSFVRKSCGAQLYKKKQQRWVKITLLLSPDFPVDWIENFMKDKTLSASDRMSGPERWWTILCYNEAMGNCGGGSKRYWRANRLSNQSIGAKDSSNYLVAGFFWSFPQDSWSPFLFRPPCLSADLCDVEQRMRGIFIAGKLLANLSSNCECAWLPLTGEKIDSAALSFTRVLSSFDTLLSWAEVYKNSRKKKRFVFIVRKNRKVRMEWLFVGHDW